MGERLLPPGVAFGFPAEQGLPAAADTDHGDLMQVYTLLSTQELTQMNQSAEAIVLDLTTPDVFPPTNDIFIADAESPHPADVVTP